MPVLNSNVVTPLSGPGDVFVKMGAGALTQLGWSEQGLRMEISPEYIEVFSDRAGPTQASLRLAGGAAGVVACTLTEFDYALATTLLAAPSFASAAAAGSWGRLDIGAKVTGTLQVAIRHTFFGTAAASVGLPAGYLFYNAFVAGYAMDPIGTRAPKLTLAFECHKLFDPTTCTWKLFSTTDAALTGLGAPCTAA